VNERARTMIASAVALLIITAIGFVILGAVLAYSRGQHSGRGGPDPCAGLDWRIQNACEESQFPDDGDMPVP
jgi:hypothetical protein